MHILCIVLFYRQIYKKVGGKIPPTRIVCSTSNDADGRPSFNSY